MRVLAPLVLSCLALASCQAEPEARTPRPLASVGPEPAPAYDDAGEPAQAELDLTGWAGAEVLLDNVEPAGSFTGRLEPWQALVLRRTQG